MDSRHIKQFMAARFVRFALIVLTVLAVTACVNESDPEPPQAPANVSVLEGDGKVRVSWQVPDPRGGKAEKYVARALEDSSRYCETTGLSCEVTGLTNGIAYTFTVTAENAAGSVTSSPTLPVKPSPDQGISWTLKEEGVPGLLAIAWGAGRFIGVGQNSDYGPEVWGSLDGVTWESKASDYPGVLRDVLWTGSRFVAVGGYLTCGGLSCCISCHTGHLVWTSPDGEAWVKSSLNTGSGSYASIGSRMLYAVRAVSGGLLAVGEKGTLLTSTLGDSWTRLAGPELSYDLTSLASLREKTVVIGREGSVLSNGTGWEAKGTDAPGWVSLAVSGEEYLGGVWVAVGEDGRIRRSLNGIDWETRPSPTEKKLNAVIWTGTHFVAVGDIGTLLTSRNGLEWTERASGTQKALTSVTFANGKLLAVGPGVALTSP